MSDASSGLKAALVYLCSRRVSLQLLFYGSIVGLFINVVSLVTINVSPATEVVILFNFIGLILLGGFSGYVLLRCLRIDS